MHAESLILIIQVQDQLSLFNNPLSYKSFPVNQQIRVGITCLTLQNYPLHFKF